VDSTDQVNPVMLGDYEAWSQNPSKTDDGGRTASYVIPTASGKVEITCAAGPSSATNTLALCERTASTLRLGTQKAVTLGAVKETAERWQAAATRLKDERAAARSRLAKASQQPVQIQSAEALAGIYENAARRFAAISGGQPVVRAARETASAYRALAAAAQSNSSSAWASARAEVRDTEGQLNRTLADG
jgi:hypothetical protein